MYTTSDGYKNANLQWDKKYESKIAIGSKIITNDNLISFNIQQSIQQGETFSIGNTISSCLNLMFLHNDTETDDKSIVDLKLGLLVDNAYEYIPLGIYNISSIDSNDTTTNLLCYDNMVKFDIAYSENNENPTLYTVINRLVELTGVKFGGALSDYKDYKLKSLKGYSCREVLGFVAGVLGTNATIDRNGKFNFVSISTNPIYAIEKFELISKDGSVLMTKNSEVLEIKAQVGFVDADNYYDYTKKNKNYKINKIINSFNSQEISLGTIDDNSVCLTIKNPFVDKDILQDIYSKINGLEYLPYSLNWSGDISIDLGDLITITDSKGVMRAHPVLSQTITYNGALNTRLGANGDTKLANDYVIKTEEEAELDRTQEDLEGTKEDLEDTKEDLENAKEEINTVKAEINVLQDSIELKVEKKEVETIKEELQSNIDGVSNNLSIIEKDVTSVKDNVASINIDLNGITQKVSSVESTTTSLTEKVNAAQNMADTANSTANANKVEIESTKSRVATIETDLDGITQRVSSTEETITEINGDITSLDSRMNTAEQKITSDAIVSTVTSSSSYQNDMDGKVDSTQIISTINQTAEAIKIDASKIQLTGDVICDAVNSDSTTTINGEKITTGTITANQISAGAITADKITLSPAANNLLKNGAFLCGTTANPPAFWSSWGTCARIFNTITGKRWLNIYKSDTESFRGISQITDEGSYSTNTMYTISLLAMPYSATYYNKGVKIGVHLLDSSNNILEQYWNVESECSVGGSTTTPSLITFTFMTGSNTNGVKFNVMIGGCQGSSFDYRITDISMVKGDYAMQWTPHISEVYSQKVNITDNGIVIRNNAGSTVMAADDLGNLTLAGDITSGATITGGTLKSTNGDMTFNMNDGYMLLYDNGVKVGRTNKNRIVESGICGISNGAEYGNYSCLSAKTSPDSSIYLMMITASGMDLDSNITKGVSIGYHTNFNNWNIENPNLINNPTAIKWDNTNSQESRIYASDNNNLILRCSNTDDNMVTITCNHDTAGHKRIADFKYNDTDKTGVHFWRMLDMHKYNITNTGTVTASLIEADDIEMVAPFAMFNEEGKQIKYTATKSLIANTEYFGTGEVVNGECIVNLPNGVLIGEKGYMVLLTPIGKKEIWLESKDYESFTVKGEDCTFDYLVKAHSPSIAMYKNIEVEEAPTEDVPEDINEGELILLES